MKKTLLILAIGLLLSVLAGCGGNDDPARTGGQATGDETATLSFSLGSIEAGLELTDLKKIKYFRIRVYPTAPLTEDEDPLFDSLKIHDCYAAGGTEVKIQDLKAGKDRLVFYEGFSDSGCSDRVAVGIRGGITIEKESVLQKQAAHTACGADLDCQEDVHPEARCDCTKTKDGDGKETGYCEAGTDGTCTVTPPVFVPVYMVGKFNALAQPSTKLKQEAAQVSCKEGEESACPAFHAAATCDINAGICTVEGLFPLSPARPRAFHTATLLDNGKILLAGGFNRVTKDMSFEAGGPFFEVFDPFTGMFETPKVQESYQGDAFAMHRASQVAKEMVVLSGGLRQARLTYEPSADAPSLVWTIPFSPDPDCKDEDCMNFVKDILSVDYAAGGVVQAMLPRSMVLHRSGVVARADDAYLVLSGGISYDKTANDLKYSDKYIQCGLADILSGNAPTCAEDDTTTLIASRYSHSDACLVAGDSAYRCNEYVLFGGTGKDAASGEVFTSDEDADTYNSGLYFKDRTSLSSAYFAEFAKVETSPNQAAKLYIFGGAKGFTFQTDPVQGIALASFTEPDLIPYQINVNLGSKDLTTALISLIDLQPAEEALRLFHTVTVLEDNRVLIAGGVGKDVAPNKNALLFQDPNTNVLEFVSKAAMRTGRFGHTATLIRHGLLKGAVLVIGGFTVDQAQGEVKYAPGGEIYIP